MIGEQLRLHILPRLHLRALALVVALLGVLALATINLEAYPATWFDEGQFLHVPRALVQHGVYADWSSEGPRYYGPTMAGGPTLLLPVAAVFRVFGGGLWQARLLVMIPYLLLSLMLCYLVTARSYDRATALLATALLLSSRGVATLQLGRQVLGEIPALVFTLAGLLCWQRAVKRRAWRWALLAGLGWGLAIVTKSQAAIGLTPAIALLGLLDWRYIRDRRWALRALPLATALLIAAAWLVTLFALLGPGTLAENLALTRRATSGALIVLEPAAVGRALRYLVAPEVYGGLLLAALVYGLWRIRRRRDPAALLEASVLALSGGWLLWFVASLGWPRYAFVGAALGALPVARMLADGYGLLRRRTPQLSTAAAALIGLALIGLPLAQTARELRQPDRSVLHFAAYLDQTLAPDVVIETWEPELGGLSDRSFHYPPQALLDVAVRHTWRGGPPARYDLSDGAQYLAIGPFGAWTGVYPADQVQRWYQPIYQAGPYTLYRRLP
jgi:hypothetical protein